MFMIMHKSATFLANLLSLKNVLLLSIASIMFVMNIWWIYTSRTTIICYNQTKILSNIKYSNNNNDNIEDYFNINSLSTNEWFPYYSTPNLNETGFPINVVPNIVHYILFQDHQITFVHYLSIKSLVKNHHPDQIIIHCDCKDLHGSYWERVKLELRQSLTNISVKYVERPTSIYGKPLNHDWINWHASDIARINILMKYGGIYLDRDVYVVKSLKSFLKFELTLAWDEGQYLGTQIIIANRNARFLRAWLLSYKNYDKKGWYYNAGELPTKSILIPYPHIVHRVKVLFGVDGVVMCPYLYLQNNDNWNNDFYTIHLLMRGGTVDGWCLNGHKIESGQLTSFNETSVELSNSTFGQMARLILS